jgi:DUF971 family protein
MSRSASRPSGITYHKRSKTLELTFSESERAPAPGRTGGEATLEIPAELLRVFSPSAEVRGHGADERQLQTGKKHVSIARIEPVGNYAIRIVFDDGHDTGLYGWDLLVDLGENTERYWHEYLNEIKTANASRLPTIPVGQWAPPAKGDDSHDQ